MANQANLVLYTNFARNTTVTLLPNYARKGEARWEEAGLPVTGRTVAVYSVRPPVKGTELEKHTLRVTRPSMKTDSATGRTFVDYVTVSETSVWVHPRATAAEREGGCSMTSMMTGTESEALLTIIRDAQSIT